MKLTEFKAWFEGYTENIETAPSAKQWDRIKEQVAKVDGAPITREVYVDRYFPTYPSRLGWNPMVYGGNISQSIGSANLQNCAASQMADIKQLMSGSAQPFDSESAMYAAGKAEAAA